MIRKLGYLLQQVSEKQLVIKINDMFINVEDLMLLVEKEKCVIIINPSAENRNEDIFTP